MKKCARCQILKDLDGFYRERATKDGLQRWCKTCQYTPKRDSQPNPPDGFKRCNKCGEVKTLNRFSNNRSTKDGLAGWCKPCSYTQKKPKKYGQPTGIRLRLEAIEVLGGLCKLCGFSDIRALQVDHEDGGGNQERKVIGQVGVYRRVIAGEKGYRCLCANCNWIERSIKNQNGLYAMKTMV